MAEMQRYQGGNTPFQQVDPTAAKESARMFSTLSQRLEQWGNTLYEVGKVEAAEKGREQAVEDIASGQPEKMMKGYSFYDRAYNDVSKAAFNVRVESDLKQQAEYLSGKYALDPQGFKEVYAGALKGTLDKIQEPEFKVLAMQTGQKLLGSYTSSIAKEAFKVKREGELKSLDAGLKDLSERAVESYSSGDIDGFHDSMARWAKVRMTKALETGESQDAVDIDMQNVYKTAKKTKVLFDYSNQTPQGKIDFKKQFIASDEFKQLMPNEKAEMIKSFNDEVEAMHKMVIKDIQNNNELVTSVSKMKKENVLQDLYSGKDVDMQSIKKMHEMGELKHDDYKFILEERDNLHNGSFVDNGADMLMLQRKMGHLSDSEIIRSRTTLKTKLQYLEKNRGAKKDIKDSLMLEMQTKANALMLKAFTQQYGMNPFKYAQEILDTDIPSAGSPTQKAKAEKIKFELYEDSVNEVKEKGQPVTSLPQVIKRKINEKKEADKKRKEEEEKVKYNKRVEDKLKELQGGWFGSHYERKDAIEAVNEEIEAEKQYGKL